VQFIDGDCVLDADWPGTAIAYLDENAKSAAVCGRRREEHPEESVYNRLIDIDWDIAPGPVPYIGGDALVRAEALDAVGGWDGSLIAGEEPDLCFRLADAGWAIHRLPVEQTLHDVAMRRFGEYWKRSVRSGHAYLQVGLRHRRGAGRGWLRMSGSILFYGAALPIAAVAGALLVWAIWGFGWMMLVPPVAVAALYARLIAVMERSCLSRGSPRSLALRYAVLNTVCKVAGTIGMLRYLANRVRGDRSTIIEYKATAEAARQS
jgi:cellulose synthase/poly-beta-1,6-N-acetylglucosamine synthase-like glycosyltransferase